ncbi:DNA/RNA non-specific endonuclease [Haliscomenobacter sp.]|uniref:DNA/RNA non-specific endonuclease n=1 Tax=Haliscomenobacter sp. TaxID=2717303 RepID=UPI003364E987
MANYRKNQSSGSGNAVKVGLFAALITALVAVYNFFTKSTPPNDPNTNPITEEVITPREEIEDSGNYLPTSTTGAIVRHKYYTLSYSENDEQAEWVAYVLTRQRLQMDWQDRPDLFETDPLVRTGSATLSDYRGSGYDRGHLAPAADMAFNTTAITESFYLSNISPQVRDFNHGVWKELEELSRDWAVKFNKLYVVTGPLLKDGGKGEIGANSVTVPTAYYKILLDLSETNPKAIAFIVPNEVSYDPLFKYVVTIDEVEKQTGINFFPKLMSRDLERDLESNPNYDLWPFSKKKFDLRVNKWNKE